ncbi:hypothetical protein PVAND_005477 [Polypedilum vanderplanki]|uniref:Uncharacterized protein n=1 Tax=Polypedilum vanderplanki TaxID=319348 RepID=A0A9J6C0L6_POLVA|nr:hypothetical protein PVAND_005477 [Polypedilum vanderplanki]
MSSKYFDKAKENTKHIVRKSILRNPEIQLTCNDNNNRASMSNFTAEQSNNNEADSKIFHQPRINKLSDMRRTLNEIKNYEARELTSIDDLNKKTQDCINRAATSKLNFPSTQSVFKNLPPLNDDIPQRQFNPQKHSKHVNSSSNKIDKREEIIKYIKAMTIEEAKNRNDKDDQRDIINLPNEDEYLGIKRVDSFPQLMMPKRKTETKNYQEKIMKDLYENTFCSDNYSSKSVKFVSPPLQKYKATHNENKCRCLSDFYLQHSACS